MGIPGAFHGMRLLWMRLQLNRCSRIEPPGPRKAHWMPVPFEVEIAKVL